MKIVIVREPASFASRFKTQAILLCVLVAIFWLVELIDLLIFSGGLDQYGIQPRNILGLRGIVLSPFLHQDFGHVAANTLPFLILGWLVLLRGWRVFLTVCLVTIVLSGLGVWVIGAAGTSHVGASGLIFGYLGFLILSGYFDRGLLSIAISLGVGLFYGGLIWGVLPIEAGNKSWEGHLFGFASGAFCAWLLSRGGATKPRQPSVE